ncbi:MAG: DUF1699 family protein [Methanothrix sp.]|nr:DUF1699 family protein [Methanothrix sp.]
MRLRVVSARNEIPNLNPNEKTIQVPPSYRKTMSNAIQVFLDMQGIELLEGDVWGHRKDLDEYFTVDDTTMEEIRSLAADGASMDDVANQIQKKARIGPELIKYIVKSKIPA